MSASYELDFEGTYDWAIVPSSTAAEILQNVRFLLATIKGTCPLDRAFGVPAEIIDMPINKSAVMAGEVAKAIAKYEPRAALKKFQLKPSAVESGKLIPHITLEIKS
ncbi:MAG: GPW/gp25 family protein [Selenomonadaceae bacterium]|nr:GPW/gp25 family protein [Selenomonadaceae bacterium]